MPVYPDWLIRCSIRWTLPSGNPAANVIHVRPTDLAPADAADCEHAAAALSQWWQEDSPDSEFDNIRSIIDNDVVLNSITCTAVGIAIPVQYVLDLNQNGGYNGMAAPAETALVTTFSSTGVGRSFRGRMFLPGMVTNNIVGTGVWDQGALDLVADAFDKLQGALASASLVAGSGALEHVIYSAVRNDAIPVVAYTPRAVPHHISRRNG